MVCSLYVLFSELCEGVHTLHTALSTWYSPKLSTCFFNTKSVSDQEIGKTGSRKTTYNQNMNSYVHTD